MTGPEAPALALAVGVELFLACGFQPFLRRGRGVRRAALLVLLPGILLGPLLVPEEFRFARLLAAVLAIALVAKLIDLHAGADRGDRPGFRATFAFLINLTSVVRRKLHLEPRPGFRADLRRLAAMALGSIPGALLLFECFRIDWRGVPFAVEHAAKASTSFLLLVPAGSAGAAIWRLLGGQAREPMDHPFASTTPADFWRRYNRPAQQFFLEDVYKPLGGPRHPAFGTLATFLVSGLLHELLFAVTIGRVQGFQVAYFLTQGVAVVLTSRLRPRGLGRLVGIATNIAFQVAASTLFFASIDEVIPFYQARQGAGGGFS